ncbi:MAG: MBL fold metallo-hydrolase [Bacteroidota bacterium]
MASTAHIIRLRGPFVSNFLVYDKNSTVLIDSGFVGARRRLRKALAEIGRTIADLDLILLTHGHFDHAVHLHWLMAQSGAPLHGHPVEQIHLDGKWPYRGKARVCGASEAVGRFTHRYRPAKITDFLADGEHIPLAGGFRVLHLPGHTEGHLGFFHEATGICFSGDLWSHQRFRKAVAPGILNTCPEHFPDSFRKVLATEPRALYPNHDEGSSPEAMWARFQQYCEKMGWK